MNKKIRNVVTRLQGAYPKLLQNTAAANQERKPVLAKLTLHGRRAYKDLEHPSRQGIKYKHIGMMFAYMISPNCSGQPKGGKNNSKEKNANISPINLKIPNTSRYGWTTS